MNDAFFNEKPPVLVQDIIHDAVIGDEITVWSDVLDKEPIGIVMRPDLALKTIDMLKDLHDNAQ